MLTFIPLRIFCLPDQHSSLVSCCVWFTYCHAFDHFPYKWACQSGYQKPLCFFVIAGRTLLSKEQHFLSLSLCFSWQFLYFIETDGTCSEFMFCIMISFPISFPDLLYLQDNQSYFHQTVQRLLKLVILDIRDEKVGFKKKSRWDNINAICALSLYEL